MDNSINERLVNSPTAENDEANYKLRNRIISICEESKKIWRVAMPTVVQGVTSFGSVVVTQSFIGHINSTDLAAYALVQTITLRFANGILLGMSSATEAMCGQAYGAKQGHMTGMILQKSWLVSVAAATILLPVFLFGTPIFKLLGQEEAIARSVGYISYWFIPLIYAIAFSSPSQTYLQAQGKNMIVSGLALLQFAGHIGFSWFFVYVLKWGVPGALAALGISSWIFALGEIMYILGGWCSDSWKGLSLEALKDLFPVVKLSISSAVMISLYLWYSSLLLLLAGYMKNAEEVVSAFSICLNINNLEYMVTNSLLGAATVRVANELGRQDEKATRFSIKVLISTSILLGLFFWILCLIFGNQLGYLFTNDKAVAQTVSDLSILLAFSMLLNGIYPVLSGVAVGACQQTKVAIINLLSFYVIGVPIGLVLGYLTYFQVKGIWIGMISGLVAQTLTLSVLTWRTNWNEEISKTSAHLKKWLSNSCDENKHILS